VVFAQQAHALGFALAVSIGLAVAGGQLLPGSVTPVGIASALGSGILYYAAAYWFYLSALRRVPASYAAVSFYLIPIFGVAGGYLFLGERLQPTQWAGIAIILSSTAAILWTTRKVSSRAETAVRPGLASGG
jgi:drug/metabolite transporter (DMT)-like permease